MFGWNKNLKEKKQERTEDDNRALLVDNIVTYINDLLDEIKTRDFYYYAKIEEIFWDINKNLEAMFKDTDKRYFDKFYNSFFEKYNPNIRSNFNNSVLGNRGYYSFFINLYIVLACYKSDKSNFDNFRAVVDDVLNYDINIDSFDILPDAYNLNLGLNFGKSCVEEIQYKDMPNLRKLVGELLPTFVIGSRLHEFRDKSSKAFQINYDFCNAAIAGTPTTTDYLVVEDLYLIKEALLSDAKDSYYYDTILLPGKRFFYVNNKLKEIESNDELRSEIFSNIAAIYDSLFVALDFGSERDSFTEYMDKVFDSDSYMELLDKLVVLQEAGKLHFDGRSKAAMEVLKTFDLKKGIYKDKVVVFPIDMNCLNPTSKPKTIIERMKKSYSVIDPRLTYDFMDQVHDEKNISLEEFIKRVDHLISAQKQVREDDFTKVKSKIKKTTLFGNKNDILIRK